MAVQTIYSESMAAAFAGMIANNEPCILVSREI